MASPHIVVPRLIGVLRQLYVETDGFLERQDEPRLWYNRGYATGMVAALREVGCGAALPDDLAFDRDADAAGLIAQQALMPWGRTYGHGTYVVREETFEILEAS